MTSYFDRAFRFLCGAQAGAQLFFTIAATQVIFSSEIAALPHEDPRRTLAADQVGQLLARVDTMTIIVSFVTFCVAWSIANQKRVSLRRALPPLLAGLCAITSIFGTTPAIHALRATNRTGELRFGLMHALSSTLLILEMLLFAWAALRKDPDTEAPPALDATPPAR